MTHTGKPGDIFVESWGYDQTNIDVYEVVRVTNASVFLMQGHSRMQDGRVLPVPGQAAPFTSNPNGWRRIGSPNAYGEICKRVPAGNDPWLRMTSYSGASLWDGERTYYDTIRAGLSGH